MSVERSELKVKGSAPRGGRLPPPARVPRRGVREVASGRVAAHVDGAMSPPSALFTLSPSPLPLDEALLDEITRRIVAACRPRRIILFGSRARGDHRPDSDVDLFVEMETDDPPPERDFKIRSLFPERRWGLDLLVYTPRETAARCDSLVSLIPLISTEGRVLYERRAS